MLLPSSIVAKAILGVDLGSLYMKVALVQRNSPLEIVTNLHSKRKTEQMVLFDAGTRFYGADANSLIARKPHLTPQAMSIFLGRSAEHPTVQVSQVGKEITVRFNIATKADNATNKCYNATILSLTQQCHGSSIFILDFQPFFSCRFLPNVTIPLPPSTTRLVPEYA